VQGVREESEKGLAQVMRIRSGPLIEDSMTKLPCTMCTVYTNRLVFLYRPIYTTDPLHLHEEIDRPVHLLGQIVPILRKTRIIHPLPEGFKEVYRVSVDAPAVKATSVPPPNTSKRPAPLTPAQTPAPHASNTDDLRAQQRLTLPKTMA
jgi:hypothetical protein